MIGFGLLDPTGFPKSVSKHLLGWMSSADCRAPLYSILWDEESRSFVGDSITYMFTKANPKNKFFLTSGREGLVMGCIVKKLVESVHHSDANVRGDTIKFGERDLPL